MKAAAGAENTNGKILLVDDVTLFLQMEKAFLKRSPVTVLTARDGLEALELARRERPDVVVMDVNMPRMCGITCCSAIKADPEIRDIPVVLVTNTPTGPGTAEFGRSGCDDFIQKPFDPRLFLDKIRRYVPAVERRELRRPCAIPVAGTVGERDFAGEARDISRNGMFLACREDLAPGTDLTVSFTLPGTSSRIIARGTVRWGNDTRRPTNPSLPGGFGIEFREITGEGITMIRVRELEAFAAG